MPGGRIKADVDASFNDILDNLNFALMLTSKRARAGSACCPTPSTPIWRTMRQPREGRLKIDATAKMLIQSLAGTYRVGTWRLADFAPRGPWRVTVDPYAGIRYTYLDTELRGRLDLPTSGRRRAADRRGRASTGSTRSSACARPGPWASAST